MVNPASGLFLFFVDSFERKGKLKKKSLNTDTFKERTFVLDRDHLYYYKNEKNSKFPKN